ncbi:hypothetical protein C8R45DRAFT_927129 [Mycena sanguinolenta]|nr:hypothetical protein C8R45DRAFT_927129 [Mycena sanguinolenta]
MAASLPPEQLRRLQDAAKAFLEKRDYGCIQVEAVMEDIFGDRAARLANPVGCEWTKYWTALEDYEQRQRDADYDPDSPPELPAMPGSTITSAGTVNAPKTREAAPLTLKLPATGKKRKAENQEDGGGPKKKPGPKPNELLDRISIAGIDDTKTTQNKHTWRCIAPACSYKRQGRRLVAEVAAHAARCTLLRAHDEDAWQDAVDSQVDKALGAVLNLADHSSKESEPTADKRRPGRPKAIAVPDSNQPSLNLDPFRAAGLKKTAEQKDTFQRTIDHKIMVLICKCGLVPDLLDRQEWADLVHFVNPTYTPTPAKKFTHASLGNQAPERLVDMITVGQWYKYHAKGATGPNRPPRNPTVAFRRLNPDVLEKTKMKPRMDDDGDSSSESESERESDADSTKELEELRKRQEELEKERALLRAKMEMRQGKKKPRKKKGQARVFPSHSVFIVDVDVNPDAPGLRAMLLDEESPKACPELKSSNEKSSDVAVNWIF